MTATTLDQLACTINVCLTKSENYRVTAGHHLATARARIGAGELGDHWTWHSWCKHYIQRSMRDINKCLALAKSRDPEAEAERERGAARERMQRSRACDAGLATNGANVRPDCVDTGPEYRAEAFEFFMANQPITPEAIGSVAAEIRQCLFEAKRLEGLAQDLRLKSKKLLDSVRPTVEAAAFNWGVWCAENVSRDERDII